jgi:hypothetical protein
VNIGGLLPCGTLSLLSLSADGSQLADNEALFVGTNVVAYFFGVTARAIQQWAKAGMPRVKHGIYDLKACHEWWLSNIADVTVKGSDDSMNQIKIEYWRAKGEAERIRVDQLSGTLISRDEIQRQWARRLNVVFSGLDQLKNRLPPILEGKSIRHMRPLIGDEINDLQAALVKPGEHFPKCTIRKAVKCGTKKKSTGNVKPKLKRGRPRKVNTAKRKERITADSSKSADRTDTQGAPNLTKSPSRKSAKRSTKSLKNSKRLKN